MSDRLTKKQIRKNLILNSTHEYCWGFGIAFHNTYAVIPLFLHSLGAPPVVILSVAGLFSVLLALPQFFSAILGRNIRNQKSAVFAVHTLVLPPLFVMGFTFAVFAPTGPSAWVFYYICFILYGLAIGFIIPIWANFVRLATNKETRGSFLGISFMFNSIGGFIGGLLLRYILGSSIPFPKNFGYGFFIMLVSLIIGVVVFLWYDLKPAPKEQKDKTLRDFLNETKLIIKRHSNFKRYILARIFFTANFPAVSLYAVYMKEKFGFAISEAGIFTILNVIAFGIGSYTVGHLGDRIGHKNALVLSFFGHLLALTIALTVTSMTGVYAVFFLLGFAFGAFMPASLNLVYDFAGERDNKTYMALIDTSLAPFTVLMIILAASIGAVMGTQFILATVGVSLIAGLLILLLWVKDPNHKEHDDSLSGNM